MGKKFKPNLRSLFYGEIDGITFCILDIRILHTSHHKPPALHCLLGVLQKMWGNVKTKLENITYPILNAMHSSVLSNIFLD